MKGSVNLAFQWSQLLSLIHIKLYILSHFNNIVFVFVLWKDSLKSDGQQFHQYQQNKQWPLTLTPWSQKTHDIIMTLEIQVLTQNCVWAKPVN